MTARETISSARPFVTGLLLLAARSMLARDVGKFLENPVAASLPPTLAAAAAIPPGAPTDPGMDWVGVFARLGALAPPCVFWEFDR